MKRAEGLVHDVEPAEQVEANADRAFDDGGVRSSSSPPASGTRRAGKVSRRDSGGAALPDLFEPAPHWNVGSGSAEDLVRVHVRAIGCFYVRLESGERYRCFNRLTGFEHITYGTVEEIDENLAKQTRLWEEKLNTPSRSTPWRAGWSNVSKQ